MDKPIILKIKDTEESIINTINKSELPAFLLRPIVEKIFNQLVQNEKNEVITNKKERWQLFSNSTSHERRAGLNKLTCSSDRGGSL